MFYRTSTEASVPYPKVPGVGKPGTTGSVLTLRYMYFWGLGFNRYGAGAWCSGGADGIKVWWRLSELGEIHRSKNRDNNRA